MEQRRLRSGPPPGKVNRPTPVRVVAVSSAVTPVFGNLTL